MTYPFVAANAQYGTRKGPVKAFVVHMAEGGGTVGFLAKPNPRNVSVHYVIERTGRIVQMVRESDATGSINPNDLRTTDDPSTFGATVRKAVMGEWDRDPNAATITVEVEGFAASGPNTAQHGSLQTLVSDVRSRFPSMGLLGHRDFQDYKACPGKLINWTALGGHGRSEGDTMSIYTRKDQPGRFTIPAGKSVRGWKPAGDGWAVAKTWIANSSPSSGPYDYHLARISGTASPSSLLHVPDGFFAGLFISTADVEETATPPPVIDCTQLVKDAKAAQHEATRALAIKAVESL